ncbi:MAG TPA: SUMF1/EgtB/PvdO family nonheme iron enzyme [Pirellulales bacterium]|nr:SUMF1/EgtB/PvdO family nonheme iron enzyme [Pirellulales bacterium]
MPVSIDRFLASLSNSGIASHDEAESFAAEIPPDQRGQDADGFARELVRQGKLTRYQAAAVYQDKTDGLVLGNYLVLDKLGAGGMGQVFRARHRRMERVVALKVLPKKALAAPDAIARFQREAKAAAKLSHPNIVTAHDADEANGQHFLVMEYVEGSDLAALVKQHGPLSVAQALDYILQAARGLEHAHAEGVVHRDIKPSNLLVDKKGTLKILDMGLARISDPLADPTGTPGADLTHSGSIMGTIDYMAPEQAMDSRQADARSDIYSLGCTLHYLLTGRPPYGGDTVVKRLTAHQQSAIPLLSSTRPDILPGLDEVFGRMLAKRPAARFQTAKELVAALEALRNQPASSRPVPIAVQASAAQPLVAQPVAAAVAARGSSISGLEGIAAPAAAHTTRSGHKSRSKAPLIAAAIVLLLVAVGAGAWMMSGDQVDETAQSQPAAEVQPPAASPSPAAIAKAEPAAVPLQEPAQAAAPQPVAESPPKPMPPEIEPAANAAQQTVVPVAAPVVPAAVSTKTPPASPPAAPGLVASPPITLAAAPQPAEQPAEADGKLPIPSAEGQREALKLIKELYKDEYAQAKQPEAKAALAEKLLNESQQTKDDATALYCVLQEARELAVEAASPALAERAIGMLAGHFAVEPLKELAASLDAMTDKPHPADANHKIAEMALGRIEETLTADDFETAKQLADTALAAGRKAKDAALTKRVVEVGKTVTAAKQQWDGWHKGQAALAKTPDDTAANLAVGRYLALVQGDWEQGLVHLAKGPDGPLKDLAAKGLKPPTEPAALAELGDAWFAASDKAKGKDKADLRAGAAYWYSLAEPGLTGLARTIVEKRLKDLGGKVAIAPSASGKMPETIELALAPGVGMKFRLIPGGTFIMGTPGAAGKELAHQVKITRAFYLGITEVTLAHWLAIMGNIPDTSQGDVRHPVENASWNDCQRFLERLNQTSAANMFRFRLPTEAEWEYACRAGTTTEYYFGDDPTLLSQYAWVKDNANGTTHPAGQLKPNAWGLFDMCGNVFEICSDWWAQDYYKDSLADDPQGPPIGINRVKRGGSWSTPSGLCRSAARNYVPPDYVGAAHGLRVVCEPKRAKASGGQ